LGQVNVMSRIYELDRVDIVGRSEGLVSRMMTKSFWLSIRMHKLEIDDRLTQVYLENGR